jgi:hypothetical protein
MELPTVQGGAQSAYGIDETAQERVTGSRMADAPPCEMTAMWVSSRLGYRRNVPEFL